MAGPAPGRRPQGSHQWQGPNQAFGPRWSPGQRPNDPFSHIRDDFGLFSEAARRHRSKGDRAEAGAGFQRRYRASDDETQALDTLGLSLPLGLRRLKTKL